MLIDTHCHLTDARFADVKKIIAEAKEVGVEKIFIPSGNIEISKRSILVAEQEKQYAMVGVHPEEVEDLYKSLLPPISIITNRNYSDISSPLPLISAHNSVMTLGNRFRVKPGMTSVIDQAIYELGEMVSESKRVIGIGEIGLDFNFDKEKKTKEKQIELFTAQMELAVRLRLPVVIHMRDAEEEMLAILQGMAELPRGQFHCFAGSEGFLKYVLEKGFYVSFAGNITFKSALNLRNLLHKVPLGRLLLETDAPYLSPEPVRGRVNTPANVKIIATAIATELALETKEIIDQTGKNALCLYSLDI